MTVLKDERNFEIFSLKIERSGIVLLRCGIVPSKIYVNPLS